MRISKSTKTSVKASKKVCASLDRIVIYDKDGIKVATTGRDYDFIATIENDTDEDYCVEDLGLCVPAHDWVGFLADDEGYADLEYFKSLGGVKACGDVKASKKSDVGARTADFIRNKLIAKGYTKEEVNSMGLKELKDLADKEGIDIVYSSKSCNSATDTDKALQHIKAAIDILGKSGNKDAVTKDSIANLGVVMLDLKSNK